MAGCRRKEKRVGAKIWRGVRGTVAHASRVTNYKDLIVWQKSHKAALDAIKVALKIRSADFSTLRRQIIGAACSVPTNIVEGCGQESRKEFRRFLRISFNSANELEYHWLLAHDLGLIGEKDFEKLAGQIDEVQKMLNAFIQKML